MQRTDGLRRALRHLWHPVATAVEFDRVTATGGLLPVRLLGEDIAVARLGTELVAFPDRCVHRSVRLSLGCVEGGSVRCAGHGWRWGADGRCVAIPDIRLGSIPARARLETMGAAISSGLVWVRFEAALAVEPPLLRVPPGAAVVVVPPRNWATSAARRIDFAAEPPRWSGAPAGRLTIDDGPATVSAEVTLADDSVASARLSLPFVLEVAVSAQTGPGHGWALVASPTDVEDCCCYALAYGPTEADAAALSARLQQRWGEDEPVITSSSPAVLPLAPGKELSGDADRVGVAYRRAMADLVASAERGPGPLAAVLGLTSSGRTAS